MLNEIMPEKCFYNSVLWNYIPVTIRDKKIWEDFPGTYR